MARLTLFASVAYATVFLRGVSAWAVQRRDSDSLPPLQTLEMALQFDSKSRYVLPVTMGTGSDPQHFNFTLTTGTGLTYVASSGCNDCSNTALYNRTLSSSAVTVPGSDNTTFFGQSVTGSLVKESCGAKLSNGSYWAYPNQTVLLVDQRSEDAAIGDGISGILGLGTNRETSNSTFGLADSIYGQWLARNPARSNFTFGMALAPPPSDSSGAGAGQSAGVLHWLKPDEAFHEPERVQWVDAVATDAATGSADGTSTTPAQDWSVGLDGWVVQVGSTHLVNSQSVVAVVDPMYPNIYLPANQAELIHDAINGSSEAPSNLSTLGAASKAFTVPCDAQYSFGLVVGAQTFVVSSDMLVIKQSDGTCVSGIEGFTDTAETRYLVGARFISTIYLIFNIPANGTSTLGFSPRTEPSKSSRNDGAIIGGTIGGFFGILLLAVCTWLYLRLRANRLRDSAFIIEDTENFKPAPQTGVEPYVIGEPPTAASATPTSSVHPALPATIPTPTSPSAPSLGSPALSHPLLSPYGEEHDMHGAAPPPSYEEASSSGASPVAAHPPRDVKRGQQVRQSAVSGSTTTHAPRGCEGRD
ncbi:hypothetical protein EIP86_007763 [Pleurotus ostreatoroseus]|nr:hypothetical protein EIP86_007763 [Pleurotus ostreatoroseus]